VDSDTPNTNYNDDGVLDVHIYNGEGETDPASRALLYFSLTGLSGLNISTVKLKMMCSGASTLGLPFIVKRITQTWNEATVTWNSKPSYDNTAMVSLTQPAVTAWTEHDITTLIEDIIDNSRTYYGLYLVHDGTPPIYANWADREAASGAYMPQLVVDYLVATTPSVPAFTMGTEGNIDLSSRDSEDYTHTLEYAFGAATDTIVTKSALTSVPWTPPVSLASQIPNATSGNCVITCKTYDGDTLIGTTTANCTLTVPSSVVPTISALDIDMVSGNAAVTAWDVFVKGYSAAKLTATAAGAYSSTVASYYFAVKKTAVVVYSTTQAGAEWTCPIINVAATDYTFTVTVTDSRGRTATYTTDAYTVYDYSNPSISGTVVFRCDDEGVLDLAEGTYISAKGTFGFSSVNSNNLIEKVIEYRRLGTSEWSEGQDEPADDTAYVFGAGLISTAYAYEVRFTVTDGLYGAVTYTVLVRGGTPVLQFRKGGGVGIGGYATANELQVYLAAVFKDTFDPWDWAGIVAPYAGDTAPTGWLLCDGSAVSRTTYARLFAKIGTTYGVGDGSTTFNLPNLKGRVVAGYDATQAEFDELGETGGEKTHLLTSAESGVPAHTHTVYGGYAEGQGGVVGHTGISTQQYNHNGANANTAADASQAHNNLPPYIVLNYIIKT
jgi:microcystin-dependent protein